MQTPETVAFEVWFTAAPAAYDGQGTIEIQPDYPQFDTTGRELRKLLILPKASKWQLTRYNSGMYPAYTPTEVKEMN